MALVLGRAGARQFSQPPTPGAFSLPVRKEVTLNL
jgi:hypothetical protein